MKKAYISLIIPFIIYGQTLQSLVDDAMKNQLVESSKYTIESIKNKFESTKSGYLPKVTVGSTYTNTNKETVSTPDSSTINYANINYVIYDGGRKDLKYDILKSDIKGAEQNLDSLKNILSLEVINYYYGYYSLIAQQEAKQKEIEQLNAQYKRLQMFFDAGTATGDEVDKIVSRVENANLTLHEIELNLQTVLHNLKYIISKDVKLTSGAIIDLKNFNLSEARADIKALRHDMHSSLLNAKTYKSTSYPVVSLDNTFNNYNMDYKNNAFDSSVDTQNILKLNFSWKIYDFGEDDKAYMSGYNLYQSKKTKYEYEKNKADVDLQLAHKSYDIAKLKIDTAKLALKAANSTYETIKAKYQNGIVDNIAYLEALSEKYSALSALKSANYDLEVKKANIIYHSGKNVWEYIR